MDLAMFPSTEGAVTSLESATPVGGDFNPTLKSRGSFTAESAEVAIFTRNDLEDQSTRAGSVVPEKTNQIQTLDEHDVRNIFLNRLGLIEASLILV